ncbi:MAG: EAL domain-containing protein [Epsilonproteobacteria bacterium]|nr:EAL domain-containing protein [Campylobacterota bacterium]
MNKLTFKAKIILSISLLFTLLLLPSHNIIVNYWNQQSLLDNQLNSLELSEKVEATEHQMMIIKAQKELKKQLFLFVLGFIIIVFVSLYLISAFYYSLVESLKKLEVASNEIASGKTKIHLQSDVNDEIGNALYAFNTMSQELTKNLSFLDGYKMAIDETSIVSKTDKRGVITYVNQLFCDVSGYSKEELMGRPHSIIRHPDMPKEAFHDMWKSIQNKKVWKGVVKNRKKNGDYYIVDATILPILDSEDNIIEYVAVRHDITEFEKSKEELAKHKVDFLTGLPNKSRLLDDLTSTAKPILLYLNIDDFMKLNDFYGSRVGDKVLIHMAELLDTIAKDLGCQAYRIYNDEFLLLCEDGGSANLSNYKEVLKEIINDIEESTIDCDAPSCISFTVSGGISSYLLDSDSENLALYASNACYMAKLQHKKLLIYSHEMRNEEDYAKNIAWIKKIKRAIIHNNFVPYFQPIIDNTTGRVVKYEALVRMLDDGGRVISPFFFLEIAKRAKLYSKITRVVLDKTLEKFKTHPEYECSINLSTEDIVDKETRSYIYQKLEHYPHPDKIVFEITESEEITDFNIVNDFIKKVRTFGVQISIDDFGTGYANFEYILNLDVDYIKIDGSLIKNIDTDEESRIITEAIIAFSKKLGTKTIVEYVHNREVYHEVVALGADYSQGYYIGKPQASI